MAIQTKGRSWSFPRCRLVWESTSINPLVSFAGHDFLNLSARLGITSEYRLESIRRSGVRLYIGPDSCGGTVQDLQDTEWKIVRCDSNFVVARTGIQYLCRGETDV